MEFFRGLMFAVPTCLVIWSVGFAIAYAVSKLF
jgi:hypothetical protein